MEKIDFKKKFKDLYTASVKKPVIIEVPAMNFLMIDGKGRVFDNIFIEQLWRTVKVEEVYLRDYQTVAEVYGVAAGTPVAFQALPPCQRL